MLKFLDQNICFKITLFACVFACLFVPISLANDDIDSLKYPKEAWDKNLTLLLNHGPRFLNDEFDGALPAPPKNTSLITQAELNTLVHFKSKRNDAVNEKIFFENSFNSILDFIVSSEVFDSEKYPETTKFFELTSHDVVYFTLKYKSEFSRVRPITLSKDIDPIILNPPHPAYPSGHATQVFYAAYVLSQINENDAAKYKEFARNVAHRREIAGVHYPSDSEAGFRLAVKLFDALMEVEEVKAQFEKAKLEFQAT